MASCTFCSVQWAESTLAKLLQHDMRHALHGHLQGIDVKDSKFNIVSPGADQDIYFPRCATKGNLKVNRRHRAPLFV